MSNIYVHKTGILHSLLTVTAKGYIFHTAGQVPAAKAEGLIEKFRQHYAINPDRVEAQRRKRKGQANARLFLYPAREGPRYDFWLLVTEGEHPAFAAERLKDARLKRGRLLFQDQYEAIRLPAQGSVARWTWRLTQKSYADHAQWLRESIRQGGDDSALKVAIRSVHKMPGFRGVRSQVGGLRKVAAGEWRRVKDVKVCPHLPERLQGYERFKVYSTVDMGLVTQRFLEGKDPFDPVWRYKPSKKKKETTDVSID